MSCPVGPPLWTLSNTWTLDWEGVGKKAWSQTVARQVPGRGAPLLRVIARKTLASAGAFGKASR
jgi:hypothetical protein